jgi:hypothetical protein
MQKNSRLELLSDINAGFGHKRIGQGPIDGMQLLGVHGLLAQRALGHRQREDDKRLLQIAEVVVERVFREGQPLGAELECAALEYPRASRIIITVASEVVLDRPAGIKILPAADWFLTVE